MRLTRNPMLLMTLLAAGPGCVAFQTSRPETIQVCDAETGKPIPAARVRISYPLENGLLAPADSNGVTAADGITQLKAVPYGRAGVMLDVNAKGYMSEQKLMKVEEVQAVAPAHWFEDVSQRPATLVMKLYAEPHASVELIAPAGYRGELKVKIDAKPEIAMPAPGQRNFTYTVPPTGVVEITGPLLFRHVTPACLSVKFADKYPISRNARETETGYWWIKSENGIHYLLIGTQAEHDGFYPSERPQNPGKQSPSGGGGQGRHGRKGNQNNQAPADPEP